MQTFTDCIVPSYGHRNQDGYVRVLTKPRRLGGKLVMKHRVEWELVYGPIPEGYEINHKCKNRECCNVDHLECLEKSVHRAKDNAQRYKTREEYIKEYFKENPITTQRELARLYGMSQAGISKLLRRPI